jgi:hypothetical protein
LTAKLFLILNGSKETQISEILANDRCPKNFFHGLRRRFCRFHEGFSGRRRCVWNGGGEFFCRCGKRIASAGLSGTTAAHQEAKDEVNVDTGMNSHGALSLVNRSRMGGK